MSEQKQKAEMRKELADAGIVQTGSKPIRFVYGTGEIDLRTVSVEKALIAARDPRCKALSLKESKNSSDTGSVNGSASASKTGKK